eukprot:TRINITY_DN10510_c0_g1_i1.p2 TRINITY_DN10510_c0_g1~~TRINITY_DN10510_c0_g1_i1.p2  ORF type:complete len:215 (+),score=11.35 TRINITY_DN10510_c0_g1_i1:319-963(+)
MLSIVSLLVQDAIASWITAHGLVLTTQAVFAYWNGNVKSLKVSWAPTRNHLLAKLIGSTLDIIYLAAAWSFIPLNTSTMLTGLVDSGLTCINFLQTYRLYQLSIKLKRLGPTMLVHESYSTDAPECCVLMCLGYGFIGEGEKDKHPNADLTTLKKSSIMPIIQDATNLTDRTMVPSTDYSPKCVIIEVGEICLTDKRKSRHPQFNKPCDYENYN